MNSQMILMLVNAKTSAQKNDARLRELETVIDAAKCCGNGGGGGCAPIANAKWYEFFCPSYRQN
jgi:hypothetical protein